MHVTNQVAVDNNPATRHKCGMRLAIFLLALIPACQGDETLSAYGAAEKTWVLEKIDETPWAARATIEFPNEGMIKGVLILSNDQGRNMVFRAN